MMSHEITSHGMEIGDEPFQYAFTGSSIIEDRITDGGLDLRSPVLAHQKSRRPHTPPRPPIRFQTDESSIHGRHDVFMVSRETVSTEEPYRINAKRDELLHLASDLIDELVSEDIFKRIDKTKFFESLSIIIDKLSLEQVSIAKGDLTKRIKKIMAIEAMSGILDDLTPEQIEDFETEVKRRPFFK